MSKVVLTLAMTAFIPAITSAQEYENAPVTISKEKVRINGQVCYSHIVMEKQTLYSISKAYEVSIEDIYKYNPNLKQEGLKNNSILIIPALGNLEKDKIEKAPKESAQETEAVQEPEIVKDPAKEVKRRVHTAKWFEDLDGIAAKYGVSTRSIMHLNNLTSKKLSRRQKLLIPNPDEYLDDFLAEAEEAAAESDSTQTADSLQDENSLFPDFLFPKKEVDMALLMPLKATGNSSSRQNMDFYSGVLLAIYDMQKEGIGTNLTVYDTADGTMPTDSEIMKSDVIIGPVSAADISLLYASAPDTKAIVSPLDPKAEELVYLHKSMIQAPTPHAAQYQDLVSWIKEDMKAGDRVLVITEKGAKQTASVSSMTAAIDSSGIEYKPLAYSILEGRNVTETLAYLMAENETNRVYIASESEAFVNDVVRNLNVMIHQKYDVVLYAPSKIRSFETIEVENFHNTKMHVSTGYYINYSDPAVMKFLLQYRALYNAEPSQFAFQGYDIARYFLSQCSKYGNRWMNKLDKSKVSMLQSTFDFIETPDGGYVNNGIRRIIYGENWSVELL